MRNNTVIYRKPETTFTKTFNEVVTIAKSVHKRDKDALGTSFICESFPKNAFMRVDGRGVFTIYYINNNGTISNGVKCILGLKLIDSMWTTTKNLNEVFGVLNTDDGTSMSLKDVLVKNLSKTSQKKKQKIDSESEPEPQNIEDI